MQIKRKAILSAVMLCFLGLMTSALSAQETSEEVMKPAMPLVQAQPGDASMKASTDARDSAVDQTKKEEAPAEKRNEADLAIEKAPADQELQERIAKGKRDYRKGIEACERKYRTRAIRLLTKAAKYGHTGAMLKLGQMYYDGELVVQSQESAFEWYKKAADTGDAAGEYKVGMMYLRGQGVKRDRNKAVVWLKKSAEKGYPIAQTNYGALHLVGMGVEQDFIQAVAWFRKAAEQNYGDAQYLMGVAYEYGEGVAQDIEAAKDWYRKAVSNGNGNAAGPLYRLDGYRR